jgi:hypothetical protein
LEHPPITRARQVFKINDKSYLWIWMLGFIQT